MYSHSQLMKSKAGIGCLPFELKGPRDTQKDYFRGAMDLIEYKTLWFNIKATQIHDSNVAMDAQRAQDEGVWKCVKNAKEDIRNVATSTKNTRSNDSQTSNVRSIDKLSGASNKYCYLITRSRMRRGMEKTLLTSETR